MPEPEKDQIGNEEFHTGQIFGHYRIVRKIGAGGMGQVYEVRHTVLETPHCLKVISPKLADSPKALEYFEREARIMAGLQHQGIVQVDEFGQDEGHHWLRMELVPGLDSPDGVLHTLDDYRRFHGGIVPEHKVAGCLRQFQDAIGYAHQAGVIHRDLKPANILLSPDGMKIGDFGIARILPKDWEKTFQATDGPAQGKAATKALMGTLAYMSPEQKRGDATQQSDLWSVALIAYQMLTGKDSPSPQPASQTQPGISPEWDGWFRKGLESDPMNRFQNAGEMLAALPSLDPSPKPCPSEDPSKSSLPFHLVVLCSSVALAVATISIFPWSPGRIHQKKDAQGTHMGQALENLQIEGWPVGISRSTQPSPWIPAEGVKLRVEWVKGISSYGPSTIQEASVGLDGTIQTFGTYSGNLGFHSFSTSGQNPIAGATFPCQGNASARQMLALADGHWLLTATFTGSIYLGGKLVRAMGNEDILVVKTSGEGTPEWILPIHGPGKKNPVGISEFGDGTILVAGNFGGRLSLGHQEPHSVQGVGKDFFLLLLAPDGGVVSFTSCGGIGDDTITQLVSNPAHLILTGTFEGQLPIAGQPLVSNGLKDVFSVEISHEGKFQNATSWGSELDDFPLAYAQDRRGNTMLSASHSRPLVLEGKKLGTAGGHGRSLAFSGYPLDGGQAENLQVQAISPGFGGSFVALANFEGEAEFGAHQWTSRGESDILVIHFSKDGKVLAAHQFGGPGDDTGNSLSKFHDGHQTKYLLTGNCWKEADFGEFRLFGKERPGAFICMVGLEK